MDLPSNVVYHILLWNYKEDVSPERQREIENQLMALPEKIPVLRSVRKGPVIGGRNQSFSHCFVMTFENKAAVDEYGTHPLHMEFALPFREACAAQVVVDFQA